jgi:lipoprotein-releasing system permease protein
MTGTRLILSPFEWTIAKRYMLPGRSEAFIALVAGISLVAVMLGVAALVIVMSVMNGFRAELFDKIVGLNGHAIIQAYGGRLDNWQSVLKDVRETPGVTRASPLIEQPLLASFNGRVEAVLVRGNTAADIRRIAPDVKVGRLQDLRPGTGNVAIGSRRSPSSTRRVDQPPSARFRARSPIPFRQSSRLASTTMTRPSWSCRCRTRRPCC